MQPSWRIASHGSKTNGNTIVQLDNTNDAAADMMVVVKGTGLGLTKRISFSEQEDIIAVI